MTEDEIMKAVTSTDIEIGAALERMRQDRVAKIKKIDTEIPIKYAKIKEIEDHIAQYRKDREWHTESLKTIDLRISEMEED